MLHVEGILIQWECMSTCLDFRWPPSFDDSCNCELEKHNIAFCAL